MESFVIPYPNNMDARRTSADSLPPSVCQTVSRSGSFDDASHSGYSCATTTAIASTAIQQYSQTSNNSISTAVSPQYSLQYPPSQTKQPSMADSPASQEPLSATARLQNYNMRHSNRISLEHIVTEIADSQHHLTEAIHPNKYRMKQQRRGMTAMGMVGGAVIGTMVFPVIGTAVGGAAAGYACNKLSKQGERRAQRKWEQTSFQRQASQSPVVNAVYV